LTVILSTISEAATVNMMSYECGRGVRALIVLLLGLYPLTLCCLDKKLSHRRDSAVQGHSRSLMLIPIESPYATSY